MPKYYTKQQVFWLTGLKLTKVFLGFMIALGVFILVGVVGTMDLEILTDTQVVSFFQSVVHTLIGIGLIHFGGKAFEKISKLSTEAEQVVLKGNSRKIEWRVNK